MANNTWSNYTEKTATPVDADEVMVRDSTDGKNKRLLFGTFWKWVAKKLNEATISELETDNKTIIGAINALNGKTLLNEYKGNIDELNGKYLIVANSYATGTLPIELAGNRFIIIGDTIIKGSVGIIYSIQVAVSFGSNKIAIRNCPYSEDSNGEYSEWRYL